MEARKLKSIEEKQNVKNIDRKITASYSHCSNFVSMMVFVSLILTAGMASSKLVIIPLLSLITFGLIYIRQMYSN